MSITRVISSLVLVIGLSHVAVGSPAGCSRSYNSSSPSGYFFFDQTYFSSRTPPIAKGSVGAEFGGVSSITSVCGKACKSSKFGFYIRSASIFRDENFCFCYTSAPIYSKPEDSYGLVFAKGCPTTKYPPPPKKRHPSPPPPFKVSGCRNAFNSTRPYGFYQMIYTPYDLNGYVLHARATVARDVWPLTYAGERCSVLCKSYTHGFYVAADRFENDVDCFCLKKQLDFNSRVLGAKYTTYSYYVKNCY